MFMEAEFKVAKVFSGYLELYYLNMANPICGMLPQTYKNRQIAHWHSPPALLQLSSYVTSHNLAVAYNQTQKINFILTVYYFRWQGLKPKLMHGLFEYDFFFTF